MLLPQQCCIPFDPPGSDMPSQPSDRPANVGIVADWALVLLLLLRLRLVDPEDFAEVVFERILSVTQVQEPRGINRQVEEQKQQWVH